MSMNDELEKLRIAKEWLETRTPGGMDWMAAWEHVKYVLRSTPDPELRLEAQVVADKVLSKWDAQLHSPRTDK